MDRQSLLLNVRALLGSPYIDPADRVKFLPRLETCSEAQLGALQENLQKRIDSLVDLQLFLQRVRKAGEEVIDTKQVIKDQARAHPLHDLRPADVTIALKTHLLDYLQRGVDFKREYDLYQRMHAEVAREADDELMFPYNPATIHEAFVEGVRSCQQVLPGVEPPKTIKQWLAEYTLRYPNELLRKGFEQTTFVDQQNIPEAVKRLLREVVILYDYYLQTDALALDPEDNIEEVLRMLDEEGAYDTAVRDPQAIVSKAVVQAQELPPSVRLALAKPSPATKPDPLVPAPAPALPPAVARPSKIQRIIAEGLSRIAQLENDGRLAPLLAAQYRESLHALLKRSQVELSSNALEAKYQTQALEREVLAIQTALSQLSPKP